MKPQDSQIQRWRVSVAGAFMRKRLRDVSCCSMSRRADEIAGPGEEYNPGPEVKPRQAASVILLRGGGEGLELLLVKRTPKARFMGGAWVFPGGAVDADEGDGDAAHRAAALRELQEEAAITLENPDA